MGFLICASFHFPQSVILEKQKQKLKERKTSRMCKTCSYIVHILSQNSCLKPHERPVRRGTPHFMDHNGPSTQR